MTATASQTAFIERVAAAARAYTPRPELVVITIAQAIQESGWGTSPLSLNARNFFGQKAHIRLSSTEMDNDLWANGTYDLSGNWEVVNGKNVYNTETFWSYPDLAASVRAHIDYITGASGMTRYLGCPTDAKAITTWLVTSPRAYATDPTYASALARLIDTYGLNAYARGSGTAPATTITITKEAPVPTEMPITIAATAGKVYAGVQTPTLIIIHDAECPCATGKALAVAQYFATPAAGGVAHYTVDPTTITHSVPEDRACAHCGSAGNKGSVGIEMCGYASDDWTDAAHTATWRRAADLARQIAGRWGIPLTYRSAADLKAGRRSGWTYHADITAGLGGTTHTDPGPNFPHAQFRAYLERTDAITTPVVASPVSVITTTPVPAPAPAASWSTIRLGSSGEGVRAWTTWLHSMFSYASKVSPGTYFGSDTDAASREFQRRVGLPDDGVVGPATVAAARPLGFKG